jgi:pyruvate dehydrogenase (quinone)
LCDLEIPPTPPHVEWKQARAMISSIRKGDPDARGIVKRGSLQKLQDSCRRADLLPGLAPGRLPG